MYAPIQDRKFNITNNAYTIQKIIGSANPIGTSIAGFTINHKVYDGLYLTVSKPNHNPNLILNKYEIGFWELTITNDNFGPKEILRWSWEDKEMKELFENTHEFKTLISNMKKIHEPTTKLIPAIFNQNTKSTTHPNPDIVGQNIKPITMIIPTNSIRKIALTPLQFLQINSWTFVANNNKYYLSTRFKGKYIGTFHKLSYSHAQITFKPTNEMTDIKPSFDKLKTLKLNPQHLII